MSKIDDFMGSTFTTPSGGVLTVLYDNGLKSNKKKYVLHCSICSQDKELWSDGAIKCSMSNLKNGNIPCGCSKAPKWTKAQYEIKVVRFCEKLNYKFLGFCGWKGKCTKIKLLNKVNGNTWSSSNIGNFLGGLCKDPKLSIETKFRKYHRLDSVAFQRELEDIGVLPKGFSVEFEGSTRDHKTVVVYSCPICKEDEYSVMGGFTHKFECVAHHLRKGILPCRCAKNYRWKEKEVVYFLNKTLLSRNCTYIGFTTSYTNSKSKFKYRCDLGHLSDTTCVGNFRNSHVGCLQCYKEQGRNYCFNGYYPSRVTETDYLYIYLFDNTYIKIGRSFDVQRREGELKTASQCSSIKLLHTFTALHQQVYDSEQSIHSQLRSAGLAYDSGWTSESFKLESLPLALELLTKEDVTPC